LVLGPERSRRLLSWFGCSGPPGWNRVDPGISTEARRLSGRRVDGDRILAGPRVGGWTDAESALALGSAGGRMPKAHWPSGRWVDGDRKQVSSRARERTVTSRNCRCEPRLRFRLRRIRSRQQGPLATPDRTSRWSRGHALTQGTPRVPPDETSGQGREGRKPPGPEKRRRWNAAGVETRVGESSRLDVLKGPGNS